MTQEIFIGEERDSGEETLIDTSKARALFVCGKRGTGKSYSLGNVIEEVNREMTDTVPLVVDPMGIYWTMAEPNDEQQDLLWDWGMQPTGFDTTILVPGDPTERYGPEVYDEMMRRGIEIESLRLNPSDISPDGWCELFDLNINKPMGIALYRAVRSLNESQDFFDLDELIEEVEYDEKANERTVDALVNRLEMAHEWGIFSDSYTDIWNNLDPSRINILDVSVLDPGKYGLRNLVVYVLTKKIFDERSKARRREELQLSSDIPKVWLFIDEAHNFAPSGSSSLAKDTLIRWIKEGRQPGLSLGIATQQPSAVSSDVVSQMDLIFCHKITTRTDIQSLNELSQEYMGSQLKTYIKKIDKVGEAVCVDDEREVVKQVQMRPRMSQHGGSGA
ncbi:ATP-binding protein [Halorubrum ezzemoulense]|jgi:DNA helicase HerA-like ATPase|uniref:ATP-binding protein n=1 Tax=Halorubrum ezzemoulense TaxID=337243 RepID=UPI00232FC503|nr:ATP-binding protein [Halorubrum ezzemoulense]MDB2225884.1 ATP-binding protein [Halorubrum ezzemoulense]